MAMIQRLRFHSFPQSLRQTTQHPWIPGIGLQFRLQRLNVRWIRTWERSNERLQWKTPENTMECAQQ